jgi:NAD(P)-dependent dehydrogenase (short-subunit alcohol dehydrogenase family)
LAKAASGSAAHQASSAWPQYQKIIAGTRNPDNATELQELQKQFPSIISVQRVDTGELDSLKSLQTFAAEQNGGKSDVALLFHAAGVLHDAERGFAPEKKLEDIKLDYLEHVFRVNTFGPALALHAFAGALARPGKRVAAAVGARVGSIGDNGMGGWYGYRASKAALNQLIKTASIEMARRNKQCVVCALHPGTVNTNLTAPVSVSCCQLPMQRTMCRALRYNEHSAFTCSFNET